MMIAAEGAGERPGGRPEEQMRPAATLGENGAASAERQVAERVLARFLEGAELFETDILQPAETLLDLYGEDMRARAYVTRDPVRGELMLRPDFTVPLLRAHIAAGGGAGRYGYAGKVFRMQEARSGRPNEYLQVGCEFLGGADPLAEEVALFDRVKRALEDVDVRIETGDVGLLVAAVEALSTTEARKAALRRHLWRPGRFRALVERFGGRRPLHPAQAAFLERLAREGVEPILAEAAGMPGLRTPEEMRERLEALIEEARTPPLPASEVEAIERLLALEGPLGTVGGELREIAAALPGLHPAVDRFEARCRALAESGVDLFAARFAGSFGRTTLEYYDGFVFGFLAKGRPHLPPLATGGRYDALAARLGGARLPAVGAVVRPGPLAEIAGEAS